MKQSVVQPSIKAHIYDMFALLVDDFDEKIKCRYKDRIIFKISQGKAEIKY